MQPTGNRLKLAIVTTHPVQYNAPWFALLAASGNVYPKVFYTWSQVETEEKYDPGFGKVIQWDLPLLKGYEYCFVPNVSQTPGSHRFNGINNPGLIKEIENWNADAVLVFGWAFKSHLKCIRHFYKKIPVLFRGDSTLLDESGGTKVLLRRLFLQWVYRHIDIALYVGCNNKNYFLKHGVPPQKLLFAPHAIDNERFFDGKGSYVTAALDKRKELGYAEEDVVLLFAGKLESKKNPFFLLNILKTIKDSRIKILFAGNGHLENDLRQAAAGESRVSFIGFQNQQSMPLLYRVADIFILPSAGPGETWGLALNEAMACGKPVIASDKAGGAASLIKEGENGFVIKNGDTEPVVNFLQKVLKDRSVLNKMGERSASIIKDFDFAHIVNAINSWAAEWMRKKQQQ